MARNSNSVTIREVARKADVSVATVSRYINKTAPVSEEVGNRIEEVMAELKYVPHAAARQLATNKTKVIGLLLTNMHNDFFAPLLCGIEAVVRENGYNLLVGTSMEDNQASEMPIGPHNTDGLLIFADSLSDRQLIGLVERDFPTVLIHRTAPEDIEVASVTVENRNASQSLIEHLIQVHGKKRIIFMHGPRNQEDSYWRFLGYQRALSTYGISLDPELELEGGFERDIAFKNLGDFLDANPDFDFDAVFAGDDDAAIGVLKILKEKGYKVPEDIAVVGFDDSLLSAYLDPPLTTVRAPTEEVGRRAAQRVFNVLSGDTNSKDMILLPTQLMIRLSCGCVDG